MRTPLLIGGPGVPAGESRGHLVADVHDRVDEGPLRTLEGRLDDPEHCAGAQCRVAEG